MKKISLLLFLLVILSACKNQAQDSVTLNGNIEGLKQDTLYIIGIDQYYDRIDTLFVKDGYFTATLQVDTLTSTRLLFKDGSYYPLYLDKGNTISIKGHCNNLQQLEITGNPSNLEFTALQQTLNSLKDSSEKAEKAEAFIRSHPFSLVSLYVLDHYFVQQPQPNIKLIQELIKGMSGELKDRPYLDKLEEKLKEAEKLAIGKSLPYFRITNAKGIKKGRADYKDKYLLIHFWASWDSLSRQENAMYRRIFQQERKNKHFSLIGISLDINSEDWKKNIKQDTLTWEQLCDFGGWENILVKQLGLQSIPSNILVSPSGIITAKNLDEKAILQKIKDISTEAKQKKGQDKYRKQRF